MADTASAAPGADGSQSPAKLDDVMLAMDVVDTLRHREHLIARELGEDAREADLMVRLKKIYSSQGIDVPEHILKEGVEGLKKARFTYEPPAQGFQTWLARAYVTRWTWSRYVAIAVVAVAVVWAGYTFGYRLPAERRAEAQRIELAETLPAEIDALAAAIRDEAKVDDAIDTADALVATGKSSASTGDRDAAIKARDDLAALRDRLRLTYDISIVSRPGESSGVWRIPDANPNARNYYLIVEAIGSDGTPLSLPIRSEEDGAVRSVAIWGQRVPERVFDAVRRDKQDDGIIQRGIIGAKEAGYLESEWSVPVEEGAITGW